MSVLLQAGAGEPREIDHLEVPVVQLAYQLLSPWSDGIAIAPAMQVLGIDPIDTFEGDGIFLASYAQLDLGQLGPKIIDGLDSNLAYVCEVSRGPMQQGEACQRGWIEVAVTC